MGLTCCISPLWHPASHLCYAPLMDLVFHHQPVSVSLPAPSRHKFPGFPPLKSLYFFIFIFIIGWEDSLTACMCACKRMRTRIHTHTHTHTHTHKHYHTHTHTHMHSFSKCQSFSLRLNVWSVKFRFFSFYVATWIGSEHRSNRDAYSFQQSHPRQENKRWRRHTSVYHAGSRVPNPPPVFKSKWGALIKASITCTFFKWAALPSVRVYPLTAEKLSSPI